MRTLKSKDLFAALRVVREVGIKDEMRRMAELVNSGKIGTKEQTEVGLELLMNILANCGTESAEKAFFAFLSSPMEIAPEELREMELEEFAEKMKELIQTVDVDHWRGFFHSLAELIKKQS